MAQRASVLLFITLASVSLGAEDVPHTHETIVYPLAPSISRLKVSYATPSRIAITKDGSVLVADTRAGVVFQTTVAGTTSILANGLKNPVSVAADPDGNAYVLTRGDGRTGSGAVYQVSPNGDRLSVQTGLAAPADFVRNAVGDLTIALPGENQVVRIRADGSRRLLTRAISSPVALATGLNGELFVASKKGQVFQVLPTGATRKLADGLKNPTDLTVKSTGQLVVADAELRHLTVITKGGQQRYATVPRGTVAVAFSTEGNMVIANKHLQSVTRVTTRMSIPCPHCDGMIPVLLKRPSAKNVGAF